ncbi:IPT/TIG domain-containing protein [Kitasatospora sp. NPDC059827]|uniref:lipase family protein n=1 Tax=Kitasatospora sp. NPDC059827 TaxID=3346964 RepID=UPI003648764F
MTTAQTAPMTPQVAMTLAAIAATAATPRPSGEPVPEQRSRVLLGITQQLACAGLATGTDWSLRWLALGPGSANLAYLAAAPAANSFAVVIRGTVGNVTDLLEDLDVGTVVPCTAVGSPSAPVSVSKGAMAAFTQVVSMSGDGVTLVQALADALAGAAPNPAVYVTGHSLGGCIATMVAPYLRTLSWPGGTPQFGLCTFAAPTAGGPDFADYVDSLPWIVNARYYNPYDVVPLAWTSLDDAEDWYPTPPGPAANDDVTTVLSAIAGLPGPNRYAQPGDAVPLTIDYGHTHDPDFVKKSLPDFAGQLAFQHADSTYLGLLGAPDVLAGPVVRALSANTGEGGTALAVAGSGFGPGTAVDFGEVPVQDLAVSGDGLAISLHAPAGAGVVAVRVTTELGTSPAVPFGQFAYGGPAPVITTGLFPDTGRRGASVTVTGVNFGADAQVFFGANPVASPQVDLPYRIVATAPAPTIGLGKPSTVNVTVLSNGYSSPAGPQNEFSYLELSPDPSPES